MPALGRHILANYHVAVNQYMLLIKTPIINTTTVCNILSKQEKKFEIFICYKILQRHFAVYTLLWCVNTETMNERIVHIISIWYITIIPP